MDPLRLSLFGYPQVEIGTQTIEFSRRKGLAMLTYLAVTGRSHSRELLANLFWPNYSSTTALTHLRRTIHATRQALQHRYLLIERTQIALATGDELWCDVLQFRQLIRPLPNHDHRPHELCADCLAQFHAAITLYREDFLLGFSIVDCPDFGDWQTLEAEILRQEVATALEKVALAEAAKGQLAAACAYWERLLRLFPLHENAQQALLALYAQTGQRDVALRRFQVYREQLASELNVEPSQPTLQLFEQVRNGQLVFEQQRAAMHSSPLAVTSLPATAQVDEPLTHDLQGHKRLDHTNTLLPLPATETTDLRSALGILQRKKQQHFFQIIDQDQDGQIQWFDFENYVVRAAKLLSLPMNSLVVEQALSDLRGWWNGICELYARPIHASDGEHPMQTNAVPLDGWLTYWEMVQRMIVEEATKGERVTLRRMEDSVRIHCRLFDRDRDDLLSAEDYQRWMSAWQIKDDAASLFRRLDLDRDGYLSHGTLVTYLRQFHFSNDPELPGNSFYGHIL